ncbi:uncharacterized protein MONBRDRAFT_11552 [Monosiga brevicollis MX1]|uniref:Transmembrane 9 superfamily member n=1 Tax=Monosiga brevicollis TaxID=81824 RepID=A9V9L5_MONBE|nr:uncharacterized protein MONBRDRAFT_11552 [Monosiga brevicollis MX1]EDQ85689.1 predicted protein [Monosiga brevicollis MX1]|eukprot:XP_001749404.1 hypothetical protein [Monosiga brevicollis MX1]
MKWLLACAALALLAGLAASDSHSYKDGDKFRVDAFPLNQCRVCQIKSRGLTLGEVLDGDRMAEALHDIRFKENKRAILCKVQLSRKEIQQLTEAIEDLFYFEFVVDDLPVRGFLGQLEEHLLDLPTTHRVFLWPHMHFHLEYNGDRVVNVNVTEKLEEVELPYLTEDGDTFEVTYTYSVTWSENKQFRSCTLSLSCPMQARALNQDFARYSKNNIDVDLNEDVNDDQGWKMIHADVFRFPAYKSLLCAVVGNGMQFLTVAFAVILLSLMNWFNRHRHHSMTTAVIVLYILAAAVAGYSANRLYTQMGGEAWAWNIVLTATLFVAPFFVGWSLINSVAWALGSTQALPATTIILLLLIWLLIGFPLTVVGGILGKNFPGSFDSPCRTKNIPREIPPAPVYRSLGAQMLIGGFLPFSAISLELYYIYATVWGREHYTLYGVLFLIFTILLTVTACITVALTYFQLSGEDYRWWWRSVFASG